MLTQKHLELLGNKYLSELKAHGRQFNPIRFEVSTRKSVRTFGTAHYSYSRLGYDRIKINKYLTDHDELVNTILHELAHLDFEGRRDHHGPIWQKVANLYGRLYNTNISRTSSKQIEIPGILEIHVIWSDRCLELNKHLSKKFVKRVTSEKRASTFVQKYKSIGFIDSYKIVRG